jgi:hypothetical protein
MFVIAVPLLLAGLYRLHGTTGRRVERATPYAIGGVAAFWTFVRINSFL